MDNRIRAFREAKGLSLDQLASLAGTSNQQISNLETGKRRLTVDWLEALGKALGCHPWSLIDDELPSQLTPSEVQVLGLFRELKGGQQDAVLQLLKSFAAPHKSTRRAR
ncbi:helix-turn-helix domain-containing protein [Pseudoxanthomonas mexicana]